MNRKQFVRVADASALVASAATLALTDFASADRDMSEPQRKSKSSLTTNEQKILYLALLAPSGHNTQPWLIKYIDQYHWIVANDPTRWLKAVDPTQRETILSIGAFIQNIEYAAASLGYQCTFTILAISNQNEDLAEVRLTPMIGGQKFDEEKIRQRRTLCSGFQDKPIEGRDIDHITGNNKDRYIFIAPNTENFREINALTIAANKQQTWREDAQEELSNWIRFSNRDVRKSNDGLTTASMEIEGASGWVVRNFYTRKTTLSKSFRKQSLTKIKEQVDHSGGWLLLTTPSTDTASLLDTGRWLQRMLVKIKEKNIAIHPMTQILEESNYNEAFKKVINTTNTVQFILRIGYVEQYPNPVSRRRPIDQMLEFI
jgi:hypothetical protein